MCFHRVTRALMSRGFAGLEIYVVDIESVSRDFFGRTFGDHSGGAGEAIWIRGGEIMATMVWPDLSKIESEVLRCADLVSSPGS